MQFFVNGICHNIKQLLAKCVVPVCSKNCFYHAKAKPYSPPLFQWKWELLNGEPHGV